MVRRLSFLLLAAGMLVIAASASAPAQEIERVEVVAVEGLIDSSVERTVLSVIEGAERSGEEVLVVLRIDSPGVVGEGRALRLYEAIGGAEVPVVTWVGPGGARAAQGTVLVLDAGIRAAAPGSVVGPFETLDMRKRVDLVRLNEDLERISGAAQPPRGELGRIRISSSADYREIALARSIQEVLEEVQLFPLDQLPDGSRPTVDPDRAQIRFHNIDLFGRVLHAAAQPSIAYLFILLGLVGIVFELFHPSTGPAGLAGLAGLGLGLYGVVTLGGSWLGLGLIVAGVAGFCIDLRYQGLGLATGLGFAALVAGSLLLFGGPWLRVSPWVLAFGIVAMVLFLLGAMTRVLRDLRAVARGELEVREAHPHPEPNGG